MRQLKKKYKSEAIKGIENLIEVFELGNVDTTDLESILHFCKSIKAGNFGKKIDTIFDGKESIRTNWRIKNDFMNFKYIHERAKSGYRYSLNFNKDLKFVDYLNEKVSYHSGDTTNIEELYNQTSTSIKRINETYRVEHRDFLINSILED